MRKAMALMLALSVLLLCACGKEPPPPEKKWWAGFGTAELALPENSEEPLYIAGYHSGWKISGVLDLQQVRALWLSDGDAAVLLLVVDCIGLSSGTVNQIRQALSDFCRRTGCDGVQVVSTHTHAGVDTLGLWGPMAMDGKNKDFMNGLLDGAVSAAEEAYADRCAGTLSYAVRRTQNLQIDSRAPAVYDENLYQLRFVPEDCQNNGIRLVSFAAHAEALRGDNTQVSRDFPGVVCDLIGAETGEDVLFLPGAIGGLILTPELTGNAFDPVENARLTGRAIADAALSVRAWKPLEPELALSTVRFETPLENTIFLYYKFLGILDNQVRQSLAGTYYLQTELTVMGMGDFFMALFPGEVFPELISGTGTAADPRPLEDIAAEYGLETWMAVGLANDEIGYILPPSDYVLHDQLPFFREAEGDHYEETNSVGRDCAQDLANAFEKALQVLAG